MKNERVLEEKEYIDLYNKGYGMYQFSPELADMFVSANSNDSRFEPFQAGILKAKDEVVLDKSYIPDWLKVCRFKDNKKDVANGFTREHEPEKD
jgi:hypothetical protein